MGYETWGKRKWWIKIEGRRMRRGKSLERDQGEEWENYWESAERVAIGGLTSEEKIDKGGG